MCINGEINMNNREIAEQLKHEHKMIVEVLTGAFKGKGLAGANWKNAVIEARRLFTGHLAHEDDTIYHDSYFNEKLFGGYGATANKFREEMTDITVSVENFFRKYAESAESPDFNRDYAALVNALEKRIFAEEKILFTEFENMPS
jgi:hypothetical protein